MSLFLSNYNLENLPISSSKTSINFPLSTVKGNSLPPLPSLPSLPPLPSLPLPSLPPTVLVTEGEDLGVQPMDVDDINSLSSSEIPELNKNYDLIELKGKGAQGEVWEAIDRNTNKKVALKIIKIKNATELKAANDEVLSLEKLSSDFCHPFIVCYYDHIYDARDRKFYIEMEYIEGDNLEKWGTKYRGSKNFLSNCNVLLIDMCNALLYIHSKNIIHRDIKPTNIVLAQTTDSQNNTQRGSGGIPKLIDFGLSCITDICSTNSLFGNVEYKCCLGRSGTPAFMAPETLLTSKNIFLSDMWSLGATFFYIATGTYCFNFPNGDDLQQVVNIISTQKPFLLSTSNFLLNQAVNSCLVHETRYRAGPEKILEYYGVPSISF